MWVVHAVLIIVRAPKSRIVDHAGIAAFGAKSPSGKQVTDPALAYREVPDHALDKHTARGRAMGRGYKHFFEEGALLKTLSRTEREDLTDRYLPSVKEALAKKDKTNATNGDRSKVSK